MNKLRTRRLSSPRWISLLTGFAVGALWGGFFTALVAVRLHGRYRPSWGVDIVTALYLIVACLGAGGGIAAFRTGRRLRVASSDRTEPSSVARLLLGTGGFLIGNTYVIAMLAVVVAVVRLIRVLA